MVVELAKLRRVDQAARLNIHSYEEHEFRSVRLMHMKNGNDATLLLTLQRLGRMVDEYGDIQRQKYSAGAPMDRPDDRPPPC